MEILIGIVGLVITVLLDYGANLQAALDYIDLVDWNDVRATAQMN